MPLRLPQLKLKPMLVVVLSAVSLAGAAYLTQGPTRPIAKIIRPAATVAPSPAVAGVSIAPTPSSEISATPTAIPAGSPAASRPVASAISSGATATPAATPVPQPRVTLVVASKSNPVTASITYTAGMDACTILDAAKSEGKISSFTADASYMPTLRSLMITEVNGYSGAGWLYSVRDAAGTPIPYAPGCSLNSLQPGYSVTWKPA